MPLSIKNALIGIFNTIVFNVFYVIMKRVPVVTNFERRIYQALD